MFLRFNRKNLLKEIEIATNAVFILKQNRKTV